MRKNFILLTACLTMSFASAQTTTIPLPESLPKVDIKKDRGIITPKFDLTTYNRAKPVHEFTDIENALVTENGTPGSIFSKKANGEYDATPFASLKLKQWSTSRNVDTDETIFFETDYKFGAGANIVVKTYTDDLKVDKQFKVDIPTSANAVSVVNDFSTKLIDGQNKLIVPIYVHHFVGGVGPQFQVHEIWLVNEDGEIIFKSNAGSSFIKKDAQGKSKYYTIYEGEDITTITAVNINNPSESKKYEYPTELAYNVNGVPIDFPVFEGKESIALIHYEKVFMENSTLEFTRDNSILYSIFDMEMKPIKTIKTPVIGFDEEDPYTFPMVTYGLFYNSNKYDFTQNVFNSDDKYELIYGIYYYDMMNDSSWYNYYVISEDGTIIKKLDEKIVSPGSEVGINLQEIPGQNDQVVMLIGEGEEIANLKTIDLPSFETVYNFPAYHKDDLLSVNFNRIPSNTSYDYLIGLAYMEEQGDKLFGVINQYNIKGEFQRKQRLPLPSTAVHFVPYLLPSTLNPHIINSDDAIEYLYMYQDGDGVSSERVFNIAKDESNIIGSFRGDQTKGKLISSGYLTNRKGDIDRLFMIYGDTSSNDPFTTEFYKVPFKTLGVKDEFVKNNKIVYLQNTKEVVFDYEYKNYAIYGIDGRLVNSGSFNKSVSMNGFTKGIYIVKTIAANGHTTTAKILIH